MKTATRNTLIASVGLVLGFVGLLGPTVGWPAWTAVFFVAFPVAFWSVVWLQRREKRGGIVSSAPITSTSVGQPIGARVFFLFLLVVVTLSGVWWLPFMGVHLDLRQRIITSIISCVLAVFIFLLGWWYATRKA